MTAAVLHKGVGSAGLLSTHLRAQQSDCMVAPGEVDLLVSARADDIELGVEHADALRCSTKEQMTMALQVALLAFISTAGSAKQLHLLLQVHALTTRYRPGKVKLWCDSYCPAVPPLTPAISSAACGRQV